MTSIWKTALMAYLLAVAAPARADAQPCSAQHGQSLIDQGSYQPAINEFTCVIDADPTAVEGYRGRIEAEILMGQYSNGVRDCQRIMAFVLPVHPDAARTSYARYADRLDIAPDDIKALTGASFARWWFYDYAVAIHLLNHLLELQPDSAYGNLMRGSSRFLRGGNTADGAVDLDRAIALAPQSADVRFLVADAYTYGQPDPARAFAEATLALSWGLDTPRVHAILAACYHAFGNVVAAATQIQISIDQVTTELVATPDLAAGSALALDLVPGRTFEIPIPAIAGQTISIKTDSPTHAVLDTIMVLLAPDSSDAALTATLPCPSTVTSSSIA